MHESGKPFTDPSGDRLRSWLGVDEGEFYDKDRIAIVPMAFCFPGYNASGSDLPPPKVCANTWRQEVLDALPNIQTTICIGGYAQSWHLGGKMSVTERVSNWKNFAPEIFVLPHPSWRNNAWIKKNPWFEDETIPALQTRIREVL